MNQNALALSSFQTIVHCLLKYAVMAPSNMNSQPWKFYIDKEKVYFLPNYHRWQKIIDKNKMELFISLGCCIENFVIAAHYYGMETTVYYEGFHACVIFHQGKRYSKNSDLFSAITKRATYRGLFLKDEFSLDFLYELEDEDIKIFLTEDLNIKNRMETLSLEASFYQFTYPGFCQHYLGSQYGKYLLSRFRRLSKNVLSNERERNILNNAPVFGFLHAKQNSPAIWIKAGRLFERIYLRALLKGIYLKPYTSLLEVEKTKAELTDLFCKKGKILQTFSLGYPEKEMKILHKERRSVSSCIIENL